MTEETKSVAPSGPETDDEELRHRRWALAATAIGYNHIAINDAKTLGHKVYFRLARDKMLEELVAIGGQSPIRSPDKPPIMTIELPDVMPHILFHKRDIELMRETVAAYDAEHPYPCTECSSAGLSAHNRTDDITKSCPTYVAFRALPPKDRAIVPEDSYRRLLPYAVTLNGETIHLASAEAVEALQRMVEKASPRTVEHLRKLVGAQKDWVCPACAWPQDPETLLDGDDDRPLPEDAAIKAAFPTRSERHDLYGEAMRMVGAKYSKGALVALVNWLLHPNEKVRDLLDTLDDAIAKKVPHTGAQSLANVAKALRKALERR